LAGMLSEARIDEKTNDAVLKYLRVIKTGKKRLTKVTIQAQLCGIC